MGYKSLAGLGRRSYRETQEQEDLVPVQHITFLKTSLAMMAGERCMQGEKAQGYRKIALSILFLGQLWR